MKPLSSIIVKAFTSYSACFWLHRTRLVPEIVFTYLGLEIAGNLTRRQSLELTEKAMFRLGQIER